MARETCVFRIGGEDLIVPALNLENLESCREDMIALSPQMSGFDYARCVLRILGKVLNIPSDDLIESCLAGEITTIPSQMSNLLRISGFDMGEEVASVGEPELPGIGTSTP